MYKIFFSLFVVIGVGAAIWNTMQQGQVFGVFNSDVVEAEEQKIDRQHGVMTMPGYLPIHQWKQWL